jgi:putative lipoprotein
MLGSRKLCVAGILFLAAPFHFCKTSGAQAGSAPSATQTLRGSVRYRNRVAIPPDAVLRVTIEDVSQVTTGSKPFAEEDIRAKGRQIPIKFEVKYDPSAILPDHRYDLRAKITSGGRLMFTTTNSYPVLTQGAPVNNVNLDLEQVSAQYGQVPSGAAAREPLEGTQWNLTEVNGKVPETGTPQASITLVESTHRIEGTGGCNRLMGSYELEGRTLHFKGVATTMMACAGDAMEQERALLEALGATQSYRLRNFTLTLLGKDGKALARLEAEP